MDITFHYPPELLSLLIDTIPLLCRSKPDVLLFFKGAGVSTSFTADIGAQVKNDRASINKFEIARRVLTRLNERGESALRERREVLRRIVEFQDFNACWPADQLKANGLVARIRDVVNVKDSFTRMKMERDAEREERMRRQEDAGKQAIARRARIEGICKSLVSLFGESDASRRGKALEHVLNDLFATDGIQVREAFTVRGSRGEGIVEQIDGLVVLDGQHYLVEMKWHREPIGRGDVSDHLVRVYHRGHSRGILISVSDYTEPAITVCREALMKSVFVLCRLEEIVRLLECGGDVRTFFKQKVDAAFADKNPLFEPLAAPTHAPS